jgi:hypothetical protein
VAVDVKAPPTLPCSAPHPQFAGLVEKVRHLRRQAPEARAGADDDCIVGQEVVHLCDRGCLIQLVVRFARDLFGNEFGNAFDVDLGPHFPRAFGDRLRHGFDMTV